MFPIIRTRRYDNVSGSNLDASIAMCLIGSTTIQLLEQKGLIVSWASFKEPSCQITEVLGSLLAKNF